MNRTPHVPMKQQIGQIMTRLRGPLPKAAVARELNITRQGVMKLEDGQVSVDRLDALAAQLGVRFELTVLVPSEEGVHGWLDLSVLDDDQVAPAWQHLLEARAAAAAETAGA